MGRCYDIAITDWGMRSVTGIEDKIDINHLPMTSLAGLPGIGKKRASKIVMARPFTDMEQLEKGHKAKRAGWKEVCMLALTIRMCSLF